MHAQRINKCQFDGRNTWEIKIRWLRDERTNTKIYEADLSIKHEKTVFPEIHFDSVSTRLRNCEYNVQIRTFVSSVDCRLPNIEYHHLHSALTDTRTASACTSTTCLLASCYAQTAGSRFTLTQGCRLLGILVSESSRSFVRFRRVSSRSVSQRTKVVMQKPFRRCFYSTLHLNLFTSFSTSLWFCLGAKKLYFVLLNLVTMLKRSLGLGNKCVESSMRRDPTTTAEPNVPYATEGKRKPLRKCVTNRTPPRHVIFVSVALPLRKPVRYEHPRTQLFPAHHPQSLLISPFRKLLFVIFACADASCRVWERIHGLPRLCHGRFARVCL